MTRPAQEARNKAQELWPGASVFSRQRNGITHRHPSNFNRFMLDVQVGWGGWHYGESATNEVDTAWISSIDPAWQYQMSEADYEIHSRDYINAGNILRYREPITGEYVIFQPLALNWVDNNNDSRQQLRLPQNVQATPDGDIIKWVNGYGSGVHFSWYAGICSLSKLITIDDIGYLPTPTVANPFLEIEFILTNSDNTILYVDGSPWDNSTKIATANAIEYRSGITGLPLWYFTNPGAYDANGFKVNGIFQLRRQGNNRYCTVRIPKSWIDQAVFPIYLDPTVDKQTDASADDGSYSAGGYVNNGINNNIGNQTPPGYTYHNNARWHNATFSGTINSDSYIQVAAGTDFSSGTKAIVSNIYFDDNANSAQVTDATDWNGRTLTSAYTTWNTSDAWTANVYYSTPSIASILQELVDSYGGFSDEALQMFWKDNGGASNDYRFIRSYDTTNKGPKLHVDYSTSQNIDESASLAKYAGISGSSQTSLQDSTTLAKSKGISTLSGPPYTDSFTGTNGTLLENYSPNWQKCSATSADTLEIYNNAVTVHVGGNNEHTYGYVATFSNNHYSKVIMTANSGDDLGVAVRVSGSLTTARCYYYIADIYGTYWGRVVNGSKTEIGNNNTVLSNGDSIELRAIGNRIYRYINDVLQGYFDDTNNPTGVPGINGENWLSNTDHRIDNWEGGNLTVIDETVTLAKYAGISELDQVNAQDNSDLAKYAGITTEGLQPSIEENVSLNKILGITLLEEAEVLPATDTFTTDTDQALTAYSSKWTNNKGSFQVLSASDDFRSNTTGECGAHWNAHVFNDNQYAQVTITYVDVFPVGPAVRCAASAQTYYGFYIDTNYNYVFKVVNGVWSQIGSTANHGATIGDVIRLEVFGTTLTPTINGSTADTPGVQIDDAITSGYAGICGFNSGSRADNWEGGNLNEVEESVTLAKFDGISELDQVNVQDITSLAKYAGITAEGLQSGIEESASLAKYAGISELDEVNAQDSVSFAKFKGISELDEVNAQDSVGLAKFNGISELDEVNVQDSVSLNRLSDISTIEEISGAPIEESLTLSIKLSVTQQKPAIEESCSLAKFIGINELDQVSIFDFTTLVKNLSISEDSQVNIFDLVSLDRFNQITAVEITKTNETVILSYSLVIEVFQEGISHVNESVDLNRSSDIFTTDELKVDDSASLSKLLSLTTSDLCYVISDVALGKTIQINNLDQCNVNDYTLLEKYIRITILDETIGQYSENVTLERYLGLSVLQEGISHVSESTVLDRLSGINEDTQCQVNDNTALNKLNGISGTTQCQVNDNTVLDRLDGISGTTQCQVNDSLSLNKFIYILVIDETIGQYTELVTLSRSMALSILQEGISHVSESISIGRSNLINISEEIKFYNSLLFGRTNGISPIAQCQVSKSLIFTRSNGISNSTQIGINENSTVSKFAGVNTSSQLILNELLTLSKLDTLAILDSRYLLEDVNLGRTNDLISLDSPSIFEEVELVKINILTIITMLYGFNSITFEQFKSIIAEPPSLYVYNDGNHSIGVLFRDKRLEVPFRDKRATTYWRDKREK